MGMQRILGVLAKKQAADYILVHLRPLCSLYLECPKMVADRQGAVSKHALKARLIST